MTHTSASWRTTDLAWPKPGLPNRPFGEDGASCFLTKATAPYVGVRDLTASEWLSESWLALAWRARHGRFGSDGTIGVMTLPPRSPDPGAGGCGLQGAQAVSPLWVGEGATRSRAAQAPIQCPPRLPLRAPFGQALTDLSDCPDPLSYSHAVCGCCVTGSHPWRRTMSDRQIDDRPKK